MNDAEIAAAFAQLAQIPVRFAFFPFQFFSSALDVMFCSLRHREPIVTMLRFSRPDGLLSTDHVPATPLHPLPRP